MNAATDNQVELLFDGRDALAARLDLIDRAERRIVFQYYIFHADDAGRLLVAALLRAADRGVAVRGLIDDLHGAGNPMLAALAAHPRIEIRYFNHFYSRWLRGLQFVLDIGGKTRRMHNKQLSADGRVSITGGRNIGDEYFGSSHDLAFADLDAMVAGPAAAEVERGFEAYWQSPHSRPRKPAAPAELDTLRQALARWEKAEMPALLATLDVSDYRRAQAEGRLLSQRCPVAVLVDRPSRRKRPGADMRVAERLAEQLSGTQDEALLVSSYFVPGKTGLALLAAAVLRGVKVDVVTNSLAGTDLPVVQAGYRRYRRRLLRAGVTLWETRALRVPGACGRGATGMAHTSLHTKAYLFDGRYLFVGCFNLDPRSVLLNTEMGLMLDCAALARPLADALRRALPTLACQVFLDKKGRLRWRTRTVAGEAVFSTEPDAGVGRRLLTWCLQWLPLERML